VWIAVVEDFAATADSSPATRLFSGNASPWREAVVVLVRDRQCVDI
jgi:hypothetical protein